MDARALSLAGLCLLSACGGGGSDEAAGGGDAATLAYMNEVMQVRAEVIWGAAGYVITIEGERDLSPTTDEGWAAVAEGAVAVKESGEFLKTAEFARDNESWDAFAEGIVVAGEAARLAAESHDSEAMFETGAQLYRVCVACHQFYRVGEFAPAE